jgi:hypothetical protein
MDHRNGKRHRSFSLVNIRCNDTEASGLVYNSSRQGLFVVSQAAVQNNQYVEILAKDASVAELVSIPGFVVHHNNIGFGLVFCDPDSDARRFVYKASNQWGMREGSGH